MHSTSTFLIFKHFRQTEKNDAGIYKCKAINKFGEQSASGSLVVKERTRILSGPKDYEAEAGGTATFRCHAEHDLSLPLTITWYKDGHFVDVNNNNRFVQSSDHSLAVKRTIEMDSGIYTCRVSLNRKEVFYSIPLFMGKICQEYLLKMCYVPKGHSIFT